MATKLDDELVAFLEFGVLLRHKAILAHAVEGASLAESSTPLFDLNGELLMRRYTFHGAEGRDGYLDIAVHTDLGNPLQRVVGGVWDGAGLLTKAKKIVADAMSGVDLDSGRFVVYNYPLVAVEFSGKETGRILIDTGSFDFVLEDGLDEVGEVVTVRRWSVLDSLSTRQKTENKMRRESWKEALAGYAEYSLVEKIYAGKGVEFVDLVALGRAISLSSGWIRYGKQEPNHFCFEMRPQIRGEWCVAACVQMVLDFYRFEFSQEVLADKDNLGLGTLNVPNGLDCARDEFRIIEVLERKSRQSLVADVNSCPHSFWLQAKQEIDENRPLILMAQQHARVIVGYHRIEIPNTRPKLGLALFNPLPKDKGEIEYWESFSPGLYRSLYSATIQKG